MPTIARVALPVPLDKTFDYLLTDVIPVVGARVRVPFGRQHKIGIVVALTDSSDFPITQLKPVDCVLDEQALLPLPLFSLLSWASRYYQYPLGDALATALPSALRQGKAAELTTEKHWQLTSAGSNTSVDSLKNAPKQRDAFIALQEMPLTPQALKTQGITSATMTALMQKGVAEQVNKAPPSWQPAFAVVEQPPKLNQEQIIAIAAINASTGFGCYLLDGVTGSGKTEVYLNALEPVLAKGKQALVLVPEIGLTPQTINRFTRRFRVPVTVLHSGLNDTERLNAWVSAKENQAAIIIGTRSALFSPCQSLGIIIVDEEHDSSYKQQDSFRYHARDLAVMRAYEEKIPIVLGSATPSLETLHNAEQKKYHHLRLTTRAGNAKPAQSKIIDMRGMHLSAGLCAPLISEMQSHLTRGNQVMLFLNRRGFAPALMCHECGWLCQCPRCDINYTLHQQRRVLHCHHCDTQKPVPLQCESCGSTQLIGVGTGTEQLESTLSELFPEFRTVRIDRDTTRRKGSFESYLDAIHNKEYQILIGTQMLAKGHHFPDVTLVALVDVDGALFSRDFRAPERLAQLFVQVAGRAGRASKPGSVRLQTHHPEHPLLQALIHQGYSQFALDSLSERKETALPPYTFFSLFRAQGHNSEHVEQFLAQTRQILNAVSCNSAEFDVLGPMHAPMARRAGQYRWQLIMQTATRAEMQKRLTVCMTQIRELALAKKVRWSVDIEPTDIS